MGFSPAQDIKLAGSNSRSTVVEWMGALAKQTKIYTRQLITNNHNNKKIWHEVISFSVYNTVYFLGLESLTTYCTIV